MLVRSPLAPVREQPTHWQSSFLRCVQPSVDIAQRAVQKPLCCLHELGRLIRHLLSVPSRPLKVFLNLNSDENEEKSYVEAIIPVTSDATDANVTNTSYFFLVINSAIANVSLDSCRAAITFSRSIEVRFWLSLNLPSSRAISISKPTMPCIIFCR